GLRPHCHFISILSERVCRYARRNTAESNLRHIRSSSPTSIMNFCLSPSQDRAPGAEWGWPSSAHLSSRGPAGYSWAPPSPSQQPWVRGPQPSIQRGSRGFLSEGPWGGVATPCLHPRHWQEGAGHQHSGGPWTLLGCGLYTGSWSKVPALSSPGNRQTCSAHLGNAGDWATTGCAAHSEP
ncbi:unnamed protein product, partial [Gulo gulo]